MAATNNEIFGAPREIEAIVLVEIPKIAGVKPAVFDPRIIVISLHFVASKNLWSFNENYAAFTYLAIFLYSRAVKMDDTYLRVRDSHTDATGGLLYWSAAYECSGFGHAVTVTDLDVESLLEAKLEGMREGGSA